MMNAMPMMNMPAMNMMPGMNMMSAMMPGMQQMMHPMMQAMMHGQTMPMMMPMMPMTMTMHCEMSGNAMVCKMTPMGNTTAEMMKECCERMNSMMGMGMPVMMMCGNMMCMCMMQESKK